MNEEKITPADLREKAAVIESQFDTGANAVKNIGLIVGLSVAVIAVVGGYILGRRRGLRSGTIVEVRRS